MFLMQVIPSRKLKVLRDILLVGPRPIISQAGPVGPIRNGSRDSFFHLEHGDDKRICAWETEARVCVVRLDAIPIRFPPFSRREWEKETWDWVLINVLFISAYFDRLDSRIC